MPAAVRGALHFSRNGGCSCSLLTDSADWNKPVWDCRPDVLQGLAAALELLGNEAGGFIFQAHWIGDEPESKGREPLADVLRAVKANRIRNKHVYVVGDASS